MEILQKKISQFFGLPTGTVQPGSALQTAHPAWRQLRPGRLTSVPSLSQAALCRLCAECGGFHACGEIFCQMTFWNFA